MEHEKTLEWAASSLGEGSSGGVEGAKSGTLTAAISCSISDINTLLIMC